MNRGTCRSRRGVLAHGPSAFTLIELLIVAAIIGILVAIAVPNFLEAWTRCRVSRTHADMRSLGTALEAYRTDNNQYPRAALFMDYPRRMALITTPVAYITDLPEDPFFKAGDDGPEGLNQQYCYASGNIYFGLTGQFESNEYIGSIFSLAGRGPDGGINVGGYCMAHPVALKNRTGTLGSYDPTNGTVSDGDILRLGSGTLGAATR